MPVLFKPSYDGRSWQKTIERSLVAISPFKILAFKILAVCLSLIASDSSLETCNPHELKTQPVGLLFALGMSRFENTS